MTRAWTGRKRFGPYFILKSLEQGPTLHVVSSKFPTDDRDYRIINGSDHATPITTSPFGTKCSAPW